MLRHSASILIAALGLLIFSAACSRVPKGVLPKEQMAQLLADIYTADAAIEINRHKFLTDSSKLAVRQAVYDKYGVDQLTVDSSFVWYGRNMAQYMEVYDRTIEILDKRIMETGSRLAAAALSIAGDSVDVWPGARFLLMNDRAPSQIVTFSFPRDANWEKGDYYTWRAKFFNHADEANWGMVAEYSDGTVETYHTTFHGDGWNELIFATDSTRTATRIYGYLNPKRPVGSTMMLDSIGMVRKRANRDIYSRRYLYRKLPNWLPEQEVVDFTADTDSVAKNDR